MLLITILNYFFFFYLFIFLWRNFVSRILIICFIILTYINLHYWASMLLRLIFNLIFLFLYCLLSILFIHSSFNRIFSNEFLYNFFKSFSIILIPLAGHFKVFRYWFKILLFIIIFDNFLRVINKCRKLWIILHLLFELLFCHFSVLLQPTILSKCLIYVIFFDIFF